MTSLEQLGVAEFKGEYARTKVYGNGHKEFIVIQLDSVSIVKIWAHFYEIKYIKNQSFQNI